MTVDTPVAEAPNASRAAFNPLIRPYLVVSIGLTMAATVIGIPLAVLWFLGIGQWWRATISIGSSAR